MSATIMKNRKAYHNYEVEDKFEAGIALRGTEVKSIRAGNISLQESFIVVRNLELYLQGAHIKPYEMGNIHNHSPLRERKLLMHKREIQRLKAQVDRNGMTLIPLSIYLKRGRIKVQVGLCRGKNQGDKRQTMKERDQNREMQRALKR
ncbi:MAG: SsrA-binding protein SmpB [Lentisphaeria bacterium]|nr:SsrA-binding protein SmpB [Lentisphaeria bacterium]